MSKNNIFNCLRQKQNFIYGREKKKPDKLNAPKIMALVEKIKELDERDKREFGTTFKHFIYSEMKLNTGITVVADVLQDNGFECILDKRGRLTEPKPEKAQQYFGVLYKQVFQGNSGGINDSVKQELLKRFNSPSNNYGQDIRIILFEKEFKEGIDLFDVRYAHILEETMSSADLTQIMGRGTRQCGQRNLNFVEKVGWTLDVYRYILTIPDSLRDKYPSSIAKSSEIKTQNLFDAATLKEMYKQFAAVDADDIEVINQIDTLGPYLGIDYYLTKDLHEKFNYTSQPFYLSSDTNLNSILVDDVVDKQYPLYMSERERKQYEEEEKRLKQLTEEAEKQRIAEENARKQRLEAEQRVEAERQRLAIEEAERQRMERQRLIDEEIEKQRIIAEEAQKRLEAANKFEEEQLRKMSENQEQLRLQRLAADEAEKLMLQRLDEENRKRKFAADEAEKLMLQRLTEESEQRRIEAEAEQQRLYLIEEDKKRLQEEAERQRFLEQQKLQEAEEQRLLEQQKLEEEAEQRKLDKKRKEEEMKQKRLLKLQKSGISLENVISDESKLKKGRLRLDGGIFATHQEFQEYIYKVYGQWKWIKKLERDCPLPNEPVSKKETTLNSIQKFLKHYFTPQLEQKGMLLWHSVGSGKTCTGIAIASAEFEEQGYNIVWVTRPALKSAMEKNIFEDVVCHQRIKKGSAAHSSKKFQNKLWNKAIGHRTFSNLCEGKASSVSSLAIKLRANGKKHNGDFLYKTLVIIDEAHFLYGKGPQPLEKPIMKHIEAAFDYSYLTSGENSVKVLLMTATPITEKPDEFFKLINLCKHPRDKIQITNVVKTIQTMGWQSFIDTHLSGYISYVNRMYDPSQFAQIRLTDVPVEMSTYTDTKSKNNQEYAIMTKCFKVNEKNIHSTGKTSPKIRKTIVNDILPPSKGDDDNLLPKGVVDNLMRKREKTMLEKFAEFESKVKGSSSEIARKFEDIMKSSNAGMDTPTETNNKIKQLFSSRPDFLSQYYSFFPHLAVSDGGKRHHSRRHCPYKAFMGKC